MARTHCQEVSRREQHGPDVSGDESDSPGKRRQVCPRDVCRRCHRHRERVICRRRGFPSYRSRSGMFPWVLDTMDADTMTLDRDHTAERLARIDLLLTAARETVATM